MKVIKKERCKLHNMVSYHMSDGTIFHTCGVCFSGHEYPNMDEEESIESDLKNEKE